MASLKFQSVTLMLALVAALLGGCETAPPPGQPRTPTTTPQQSQPAGESAPSATASAPVSPMTAEPTAAGPTSETPISEYLTVLERYDSHAPALACGQAGPGNRLTIDTRNVRRLRIDREAVPLRVDRNVVLQLDGQGFEWLAGSAVTEFERSDNGVWSPVKPNAARQ